MASLIDRTNPKSVPWIHLTDQKSRNPGENVADIASNIPTPAKQIKKKMGLQGTTFQMSKKEVSDLLSSVVLCNAGRRTEN